MLVVIRFGSELPIPGVKTDFFANFFANQSTDAFGFFNAMTGGSFSSMSIFRTEHHPVHYIFHYHAAAHDRNSETGRDAAGRRGRQKEDCRVHPLLNGWACTDRVHRYGSRFRRPGTSDHHYNVWSVVIAVATMTAGSAFLDVDR